MNIFPRNIDIKVFESVIEQIADLGANAIIFSDPGTYRIIKKYLPNMPLHLSTQTSTLNTESVRFWYDLGVKRVVLARELHIKEIEQIKKAIPEVELEIFVHGAMCITYSGRCSMGEYFSGRDGNKGECSHVCRYKFKVYLEEEKRPGKLFQLVEDGDGSYLLSSKDLCTIERLGEILPFVDGLKIEGRSKSELYVGAVVKAYKHTRDAILNKTAIDETIKNLVYEIPHRYYWDGFLFNSIKNAPDSEEKPSDYDLSKTTIEKISIKDIKNNQSNYRCEENDQTILSTVTKDTAGPVGSITYYGLVLPDFVEKDGKKYFKFVAKQQVYAGDMLKYLSPDGLGETKVLDIIDLNMEDIPKTDCNKDFVYVLFDKQFKGFEVLYK